MKITKSHKDWVFIAKGIGITLVAIGHFTTANNPDLWRSIKEIIYTFHMPLFFILSSYLYSGTEGSLKNHYDKKVHRLIYPFISIAILFLAIKYVAALFLELQNPVTFSGLSTLITNPVHSYMPLLWFLHCLFIIFIAYPLLQKIMVSNMVIAIWFVAINIIIGSDTAIIGNSIYYLPFFALGVSLRSEVSFIEHKQYKALSSGIFLAMFIAIYHYTPERTYLTKSALGLTGALFTILISQIISTCSLNMIRSFIMLLGYYSMSIYLFHTLFESAVRIFFSHTLGLDGVYFWLAAATAIFSGLLFPLLLEKHFLRENKYTRIYILGLEKK